MEAMKTAFVYLLAAVLVAILIAATAILRVLRRQSLFAIKQRAAIKDTNAVKLQPLFTKRHQTGWLARGVVVVAQLCLVLILAWDFWAPVAVVITATGLLIGSYALNYLVAYEQAEKLAVLVAPYVNDALVFITPVVVVLRGWFVRRPVDVSLPFNSKEELLSLVRDSESAHIQMTGDERSIAIHALSFSDKFISDVMVPRRVVKGVDVEARIDLKLLKQLHDSGFSRFPVFEGDLDHVVGTLYLKNLVGAAKSDTRKVKDVYDKHVYFVNQTQTLNHALNAFLRTKHHLFVVVNEFQEMTGVITIEDILEQLIGRKIVDEFDKYDDLREVAALAAKKDKKSQPDPVEAEAKRAHDEPPTSATGAGKTPEERPKEATLKISKSDAA